MKKIKVGFAICGSFCTISNALEEMNKLIEHGYEIYPIISPIVSSEDTRFTNHITLKEKIEKLTGKKPIETIVSAEPIGPNKPFDVLAVCPCTGNTLAKLANGITDTSVTMAVKAHIRNNLPVVIALATNDALGASAKNIGALLNTRNFYFVPLRQDDPKNKERSVIADFLLLEDTILKAIDSKQTQPILK